jgi:hypothetical protein
VDLAHKYTNKINYQLQFRVLKNVNTTPMWRVASASPAQLPTSNFQYLLLLRPAGPALQVIIPYTELLAIANCMPCAKLIVNKYQIKPNPKPELPVSVLSSFEVCKCNAQVQEAVKL